MFPQRIVLNQRGRVLVAVDIGFAASILRSNACWANRKVQFLRLSIVSLMIVSIMGKLLPFLLVFLSLFPVTASASGGKKPPPMSFRIHAETHPRDTEVFAMPLSIGNPPVNVFIERMALVTENEVKAMYPFESQLGGYGVYFQLDAHGTKVWETITTSRRDGFLAVVFNGRPVSRLRLGRPVQDGIVMVPGGVTAEEVQAMAQRYPFIGESPQKTEQRKKQKGWMP